MKNFTIKLIYVQRQQYQIIYIIFYLQSTMPRVHSQNRQKNKPFKGGSKAASSAKKDKKKASTRTKPIAKRVKHTKHQLRTSAKIKKMNEIAKISTTNQYLDNQTKSIVIDKLKNQVENRVIVLIPGNKQANTNQVLADLYQLLAPHSDTIKMKANFMNIPYHNLEIIPTSKSFIKNKLLLVSGVNSMNSQPIMDSLTDLIKCADILMPVLSCKQTNIQMINLDPHQAGGAFDDIGYALINIIRSMGTPTMFSLIQDLSLHEPKNYDKIQRLFRRFIVSQFGQENDKITYLKNRAEIDEYKKMLRVIDTMPIKTVNWKKQRGYMMVEQITKEENNSLLTFHGYLKGNCVHANQLVHITGFDDYQIEKIQIKDTRHRNKQEQLDIQNNLIQYSTTPQPLFPFSKADTRDEDLLTAFEGLKLNLEANKNNMNDLEEQDNYEDMDSEEESNNDDDAKYDLENYIENQDKEAEKQRRYIEMQMRDEDQLEFEDQVEYAAEQILREKYSEYQGLKNFKTSEWNHLQNLPDQYDRIYTFKHYTRTHHSVCNENQKKGFAYPGFYISVTLRNVPEQKLFEHIKKYPTIITFLLKHERKMTQLHLKVKRNPYYPSNVNNVVSNEKYMISLGFRRFTVNPIFSRIIQGSQKTKYIKCIKEDYESYFYCSFYYYNTFPSSCAQIYRVNPQNVSDLQPSPIMYGQLAKVDPLHCILERIILTGYPFKIHKRKSTIRYMFFNPKDVKYFKPVQVRSKMGLKGRIEESLGTHGHMKVMFNDKIKHNDTVCMHLYRRVYPQPWF